MSASITVFRYRKSEEVTTSDLWPFTEGARALTPILPTGDQSRYAEYREHAAECLEIANHWSDLIKQQYEELARQWLILAK